MDVGIMCVSEKYIVTWGPGPGGGGLHPPFYVCFIIVKERSVSGRK